MDAQKAFKRIYRMSFSFLIVGIVLFNAYLYLIVLFSSSTLNLGFLFVNMPLDYEFLFWSMWSIRIGAFTVWLWSPIYYSIILFKVNYTFELILIALILASWVLSFIVYSYSVLLLRLVKNVSSRKYFFKYRIWNLPPSNRYKTYGEAKSRIKHLIKNGTLREKMAIYMHFIEPIFLFVVLVIIMQYTFFMNLDFTYLTHFFYLILFVVSPLLLFEPARWFLGKTLR